MRGERQTGVGPASGVGNPEPGLIIVNHEPFNAECPLSEQAAPITPNHLFYVRNHFPIPACGVSDWRLTIAGEVEQPYELNYEQFVALPSRSLTVTMECAGNGRALLRPETPGDQWRYGAVSTAEWTGVPLGTVLAAAGLRPAAREVVVEGADHGWVTGKDEPIRYARGLDLEKALHPDTLLAYAMNGEPLPVEHGFPVRLVVPGWYGMAAVKWVKRIEVISGRFTGFYQAERYIIDPPKRGDTTVTPLTTMRTRSLITTPEAGSRLPLGEHVIRGLAWSGVAPVRRVEVSVDDGETWEPADLAGEPSAYAWRLWEFHWRATTTGPLTLRSRAFDAAGNAQPVEPEWNRLGYANNAIQTVEVIVE
jgi:DMSO/TMAO reductase YedYZ molybdopterin-dependent catalytic subunit